TRLSSVLTLTPRPQDHGASLTCQVMFPAAGVTVEGTVQLNVTDSPQNLTINVLQGNVPGTSGPRAELVLVAIGEAAIKTVLLLLFLVVLAVRYQRRKATKPTAHMQEAKAGPDPQVAFPETTVSHSSSV
ncbi:sialic acid-binding Ig-like lectin 13, partial [Pteropus vampyrus]|uniref:Sialic acid-binding Ig-like lectin 13 n=1 Tax=Pteropus vampyrus TaxID=132908 RepID=A0A6P3S080_PTEVA